MNNGKYHTIEYKKKQEEKVNSRFGKIEDHTKQCQCCGNNFVFNGRLKTKQYDATIFCSRGCANNRQTWWNDNATHYKTIALQHHAHECIVCGFDKIVAIHHIDENKQNNNFTNLIPLCPNHHEMVHSKWKNEVIPYITKWQEQWAVGIVGTQ